MRHTTLQLHEVPVDLLVEILQQYRSPPLHLAKSTLVFLFVDDLLRDVFEDVAERARGPLAGGLLALPSLQLCHDGLHIGRLQPTVVQCLQLFYLKIF